MIMKRALHAAVRGSLRAYADQHGKRQLSAVAFKYQPLFEDASQDPTPYRLLTSDYVSTAQGPDGKDFIKVEPEALTLLSKQAMIDVTHLLRPAHLQQLSNILKDKEASENDKFVALELLKNANVAAGMVLPSCQDTDTGVCIAKRGSHILTDGDDEAHISRGIYDAYTSTNLRYSQVAPQDMFKEANTKTNLPAQIDLYETKGDYYKFLLMVKGGGSANRRLRQQDLPLPTDQVAPQ
jgi:fumarate hydratase class I